MGWRCAVASCRKVSIKGFSAYAFPEDPEKRKIWIKFCGQPKNWVPEKSRICEYHFKSDDFLGNGGRQHLKYGSIPTNYGNFKDIKQEPDDEESSKEDNDTYLDDVLPVLDAAYEDPFVENETFKEQTKVEASKKKSCRICMAEVSKQFISLFAKLNGEYIAQILTFCTALEVERDDFLPQYICDVCFPKLRTANILKITSLESDMVLRNQIIKQENFEQVNGFEFEQFLEYKEDNPIVPRKSKKRSLEPDITTLSDNMYMIDEDTEIKRKVKKTDNIKKVRKEPLLRIEIQKRDQCESNQLQCLDCGINYTLEQNHRCYTTKQCSICNTMVGSQKLLVQHFKDSHIIDRECGVCKLVCGSALSLHFHLRTHQEGLSFICDVCGKAFSKADYLKRHIPSHFEHFQCDICNVIIKRKTGLQRHMNTIHLKNANQLVCPECGLFFKTSNVLQFHLIRIHNAPTPVSCEKCGKKFVYPSQLKGHDMRVHLRILPPATGSKDLAYKCSYCTKSFKLHSIMQAHEKLHTDGVPMLNNQYFLKHKCKYCDKRFKHKNLLNDHVTVHTKERAFKCYNCEKTFKTTIGLRKHLKNVHKEIKPFVSSNPNYHQELDKYENK